MIQPADIYILAGVIANESEKWTLRELAGKLFVDHTLVHRALRRAEASDLYSSSKKMVHRPNFEELLVHGGRFLAPARPGALVPGVPAAWAAEPMRSLIHEASSDPPLVWPSPESRIRGQSLRPLHPACVEAVATFPSLGELMSVIDSLRAGDLRVRRVAAKELHDILRRNPVPRQAVA